MLSATFDLGGQGWRIHEAFSRLEPDWDVRSVVKDTSYLAYPTDLPFRRRELDRLYLEADVIHARNDFSLYDPLAAEHGPKPLVIHYHGTKFRSDPNYWITQQRKRGAIGLVSTLDLFLLAPEDLVWLPAPYAVDDLLEIRRAQRAIGPSRK